MHSWISFKTLRPDWLSRSSFTPLTEIKKSLSIIILYIEIEIQFKQRWRTSTLNGNVFGHLKATTSSVVASEPSPPREEKTRREQRIRNPYLFGFLNFVLIATVSSSTRIGDSPYLVYSNSSFTNFSQFIIKKNYIKIQKKKKN